MRKMDIGTDSRRNSLLGVDEINDKQQVLAIVNGGAVNFGLLESRLTFFSFEQEAQAFFDKVCGTLINGYCGQPVDEALVEEHDKLMLATTELKARVDATKRKKVNFVFEEDGRNDFAVMSLDIKSSDKKSQNVESAMIEPKDVFARLRQIAKKFKLNTSLIEF